MKFFKREKDPTEAIVVGLDFVNLLDGAAITTKIVEAYELGTDNVIADMITDPPQLDPVAETEVLQLVEAGDVDAEVEIRFTVTDDQGRTWVEARGLKIRSARDRAT